MLDICLMLKTYAPDIAYAERLVRSFHRHNSDSLQLYVVVPSADLTMFKKLGGGNVELIVDEDIPVSYASASQAEGRDLGFVNAGISKLGFWELDVCKNYFSVDSDLVFIRNFSRSDFLDEEQSPYLVCTEARDLAADPFYFRRYWLDRQAAVESVARQLGVLTQSSSSYHTVQVLNAEILQGLKAGHLDPQGLDYLDLMISVPWEYFWYTTYALHQTQIRVRRCDEMVKVIHHQGQHLALLDMGLTEADLARSYLGITVNSNWSRQYGLVNFDNAPVAAYRAAGEWAHWHSSRAGARQGVLPLSWLSPSKP